MKIKYFTDSQMKELYHALDQAPDDPAHVLIELLALTGMRLAELCSLTFGDFDERENVLTIRFGAKDSHARSFKLPLRVASRLLRLRDELGLGYSDLLTALISGSEERESRCRAVRRAFEAIKARAWPGRKMPGVHGLRHTAAKRVYERTNGNIHAVQTALGHKSILNTQLYLPMFNGDKIREILGQR